ncbi:MAG: DUF4489 domain-containing protein [Clostridium sp.]|nr:DUF4489 domain-containing protein [Clostridium sp.]
MKIVDNDHGCDSCGRSCKRDRDCCCSNSCQKPGKSILNCGCGGVGPLPDNVVGGVATNMCNPIPVASVSIDTRCMECPKVLLHFTSQINLPIAADVTLNFMICRTTKCGCPQYVGGTFTFSAVAAALEAESFSFQYCDCNPCPDCTTYTVSVEPSGAAIAGVTITNAMLTALAVEDLC